MSPRYLLISLICLGWLLTAGCTPSVEPAPTVPATMPAPAGTPTPTTRPITTPTPAATPLPDALLTIPTPTFEPGASPVRPTLSLPEVRASQTALWADIYASTPTWTPTPTFTPIPGPVWRILFRAVPCPPSYDGCSQDLYMSGISRWYLIHSDGSDLVTLEDTETFPANMWPQPYLSPDSTHLAYLIRSEADDELHMMLSEINSGLTSDLGVAPQEFRELKFLPEPDCLAVYSSPGWKEAPTIETITVTRLCANSTEHQILETIEFSNVRPFSWYRLSPQGDALLIRTRSTNNLPELYVYEFGSQKPPHLLFTAEDDTWFLGPVRWLPDGQGVEFFAQRVEPDGSVKVLLYEGNRPATDIQVKLELELPFSLISGDWSPDGRELAFFPGMPRYTPETSGVYILDLESGEWRQIVSGLYNAEIHSWQTEVP